MMTKRTKKILFSTFGIAATALTVIPLAVGLTSCGSTTTTTTKKTDTSDKKGTTSGSSTSGTTTSGTTSGDQSGSSTTGKETSGTKTNKKLVEGQANNPVLAQYDNYLQAKENALKGSYMGLASDSQRNALKTLTQDWITKFENLKKESSQLKLNSDQVVWMDSILYNLKQELVNYNINIQWLGGLATDNGSAYPLSAFNNYVVWNAESAQGNAEQLTAFTGYLKQLQTNFEEGAKNNVAQSIIIQRLFMSNMLQTFYSNELQYWANPANASHWPSTGTLTIAQFLNVPEENKTNFFGSGLPEATVAQKQLDAFVTYFGDTYFANAIKADSSYGFGGTTRPLLSRTESSTDKEVERTVSFTEKGGTKTYIYGLGLTQKDLDTKDVGLSFMKNSEVGSQIYDHLLALSTTTDLTPDQVFQNGVKDTNDGVANMKALANAVVALETGHKYVDASDVKGSITPQATWDTTILRDNDGIGSELPTQQKLSFKYVANESEDSAAWTKNWQDFNHWLNDEDFFWGREVTAKQVVNGGSSSGPVVEHNDGAPADTSSEGDSHVSGQPSENLVTHAAAEVSDETTGNPAWTYANNTQSLFGEEDYKVLLGDTEPTQTQLNKYGLTVNQYNYWKGQLQDKGYWKAWNVAGNYGSIPAKSVLCSTFTEYRDYVNFIENYAMKYENGKFTKSVEDFTIVPYAYVDRNNSGVGASGGPNDNHFYLNIDPYNDLQKWSETSFTSHETVLGHRTQGEYVHQYGAEVNGKRGPVYSFTSYAEGWAVFVEWFENQIGAYGKTSQGSEPVNLSSGLPVSFKGEDTEGFVAGDKHGNSTTGGNFEDIKIFQNGVYWNKLQNNKAFTLKDDKAGWGVATELGNMLQYYGFLNEAQLRNMRQVVDTAYHAPLKGLSDNGLTGGASIQDVRNYLHAHSALGVGDVANESVRYLAYPAQATSYMTGKHVMETIYTDANKAYQAKHSGAQILTDQTAMKKLFDLYLRDGCIPLDVLKNSVEPQIPYVIDDTQKMIEQNRVYNWELKDVPSTTTTDASSTAEAKSADAPTASRI
ncbi:DUF885 family protein [Ureaplasma ceti]